MNSDLNTLNSLKQQLESIRINLKSEKIKCSDDVMNVLKEVTETQIKIEGMLADMKEKYEKKHQQVTELQSAFADMEKTAEAKVQQRSTIEKWTYFIISWWWVYLMAQKYVLPYFY